MTRIAEQTKLRGGAWRPLDGRRQAACPWARRWAIQSQSVARKRCTRPSQEGPSGGGHAHQMHLRMVERHDPEDSLGLPLEPAVVVGLAHPTRRRPLGRVVDGITVQRDDVGRAQLPRRLRVGRRVLGIEAEEEEVVVGHQFVHEVFQSPDIVVAIGLHPVGLERLRPRMGRCELVTALKSSGVVFAPVALATIGASWRRTKVRPA